MCDIYFLINSLSAFIHIAPHDKAFSSYDHIFQVGPLISDCYPKPSVGVPHLNKLYSAEKAALLTVSKSN